MSGHPGTPALTRRAQWRHPDTLALTRRAQWALVAIVAIFVGLAACTRGGDASVPRRIAYPRIALYDTVYSVVDTLPVAMELNRAIRYDCERRDDGAWWVNLHYDRYGATVYCTLTPVDRATVDAVVDNRAERIHRNISQTSVDVIDIDSPGAYHSNMVVARGGSSAPVQFLSVNPEDPRWVLSGTAFFDNAPAGVSADSVAPIVDALSRDISRMLRGLKDTAR